MSISEVSMEDFAKVINQLEERILSGGSIERSEAEQLLNVPDEHAMRLAGAADRIRIRFKGNQFDSCSLINARSGRCSEDCAFCAQSGHHNGDCEVYDLKSGSDILQAARQAKAFGASRFCTVTSGGALSDDEFDSLMESLKKVREEVDINLDASLGFLTDARADRLKAVGVTRYNHNLETSPDYYSQICTTHNFEDRVKTVKTVLNHGFSACAGGIIGMGETPSQRLELAFTCREVGIDCVPVNILNPRAGTPLENAKPLEPMEIIKTISIFRFILPKATIKVAGGREKNLGDFQALALRAGANGMIIGGYLTTTGRQVADDLRMVRQAGYEI
jgi:biotin synthase